MQGRGQVTETAMSLDTKPTVPEISVRDKVAFQISREEVNYSITTTGKLVSC